MGIIGCVGAGTGLLKFVGSTLGQVGKNKNLVLLTLMTGGVGGAVVVAGGVGLGGLGAFLIGQALKMRKAQVPEELSEEEKRLRERFEKGKKTGEYFSDEESQKSVTPTETNSISDTSSVSSGSESESDLVEDLKETQQEIASEQKSKPESFSETNTSDDTTECTEISTITDISTSTSFDSDSESDIFEEINELKTEIGGLI